MLQVKTFTGPSPINGIGLFAGEDIPKGTITWRFQPGFDAHLEPRQVEQLPPIAQAFIETYCALSTVTGQYVLYADDARFTNHSNTPCIETVAMDGEPEMVGRASRGIGQGEELTVNYRKFDAHDATGSDEYLND